GIFVSIDTFDDEFSAPEFSELIDEFPVHSWIGSADAGHVDSLEHRAFADGAWRLTRAMTRSALGEVPWPSAPVGFTVAARRCVHATHHPRGPRCFHPAQKFCACFPLARRIELITDRPAESFVDIFDGSRCHRKKTLQCPARGSTTRDRQFT